MPERTPATLRRMGYLIGTDEAGFGPNLGPLVISATVWQTPDSIDGEHLFDHLRHVVAPVPARAKERASRVVMGDSKALYTSNKGLQHLESGLWAALGTLNHCPRSWHAMWSTLAPDSLLPMQAIPWYENYDIPLPADCPPETMQPLVDRLQSGLAAADVRLLALRSRVVFAQEFNRLIDHHGSKGMTLSQQTLALAAQVVQPLPEGSISIICDKHGGRNGYRDLLAEHFPDSYIEIHGESRQRSLYRFGPPSRRIDACFRCKAETCLPVALASMASKYLRELAMRAFNDFWRREVPDLRPTAGYPQDAKRFRSDIAQAQQRLQIDDRLLWRAR